MIMPRVLKKSIGIQGWLFEDEAELLQSYASKQQDRFKSDLLEIGSWKGRSSIVIASILKNDHRLWMIDHFRGGPERTPPKSPLYKTRHGRHGSPWAYPETLQNIVKYNMQNRVIILPLSSKHASTVIYEKFCFIFIDGNHLYEGVSEDFNLWFPHLETNGICLFHDNKFPPICRFLDEISARDDIKLERRVQTLTAFRKLHD